MEKYPISPEDCLILLAVKESTSLREAARTLNCDPAGLLRKVQRLSKDYGLLQKIHGRWALTSQALPLVVWTQESILSQKKALRGERTLRIASTTWFAERVLIPHLNSFTKSGDRTTFQFLVPDKNFEQTLMEGDCDFVVVCHPPENPAIGYKQILKEPWSVVVAPKLLSQKRGTLLLQDLHKIPFVRHKDVNPMALFPEDLNLEMSASLTIDNLVGIRSAVIHGLGWSFVPTALVGEELAKGELKQIGDRYELDRKICLWWLRGSFEGQKNLRTITSWVRHSCQNI